VRNSVLNFQPGSERKYEEQWSELWVKFKSTEQSSKFPENTTIEKCSSVGFGDALPP
jgi:hypothetical protein